MFLTACRENGESVAVEDDTSNWVMEVHVFGFEACVTVRLCFLQLDCLDAADEDKHAAESGSTAAARNQKIPSGSRLLLSPTSRFLNTTAIERHEGTFLCLTRATD